MADYSLYTLKVTTITPLHIGSGEELLNEYDFAVYNGQTWRINEAALLEAQNTDDPRLAERLARTPPAQLLEKPADFRPDSPCFRYVVKGVPRSALEGAQVREQLKDTFDRPYLPGSSLKGALRTALAWHAWGQRQLTPDVARLGRRREWAAQDYERTLLGPDPNHDLLRALQVADSRPLGADRLMLLNARVVGRGGKLAAPIELEAIRPDTVFEMRLKIDRALFSDWARRNGLELPGAEWLDRLPELAKAHAGPRIAQESAWFGAIPGARRLQDFYMQLGKARLGKNGFLVQLGWGAGWQSKTLGTHLQASQPFMERIIDDYRLARGERKAGDPFPKSRRVAVSFARDERGGTAETAASPLGWVLVEMTPVA
jgi:CRISPR-associated protein Csm5